VAGSPTNSQVNFYLKILQKLSSKMLVWLQPFTQWLGYWKSGFSRDATRQKIKSRQERMDKYAKKNL